MLIHLPSEFFQQSRQVPIHASDFITLSQWQLICQSLQHVKPRSIIYLCIFEIMVTLLTGFIGIFCCHHVLQNWFVNMNLDW